VTAFPNFPETFVRALCVGPEIQNTKYGIRNTECTGHGHGHGHGHEYGISATPAADTTTPAPAANSGSAVPRSFTFMGVMGVAGATCTQPHSSSFPIRRVHGNGHGYGCERGYGHGWGHPNCR